MSASTRIALVLLLGACSLACESRSVVVVDVAAVGLSPADTAIFPGDSALFTAVPREAGGTALSGRTVEWRSTSPAVAFVDLRGMARALEPGEAVIEATVEGVRARAEVRVVPHPVLQAEPGRIEWSVPAGGESDVTTVALSNAGGGGRIEGLTSGVSYGAGASGWLDAGLRGTSTPTSLTVAASAEALEEGAYDAAIQLRSPMAGGISTVVAVELVVSAPPPVVELSTSAVTFSAVAGQSGSAFQEVTVRNGGGGSLSDLTAEVHYPAGQPGGWLEVTLSGAVAPATLEVRAFTAGLSAGSYLATVEISSDRIATAASLSVSLSVAPSGTAVGSLAPDRRGMAPKP